MIEWARDLSWAAPFMYREPLGFLEAATTQLNRLHPLPNSIQSLLVTTVWQNPRES